ncbi:hypothetical protein ACFE04_009384 [Oxalis oulophora]
MTFLYSHLFLTTFATFIHAQSFATTSTPTSSRLVIKLIHRDSIHSPFYNRHDNITTRVQRAMKSSFSRFAHLQNKFLRSITSNENDFQADMIPSVANSMFFANFSIGQPPVSQFAIMDTGSSLLWVKCVPCSKCEEQKYGPYYDQLKSSTYKVLPCSSQYCRYSPRGRCGVDNQCLYRQLYVSGAPSSGVIATEQLTFQTSDDGPVTMPNVIFGCGHENGDFNDDRTTGVFGLGSGKTSVTTMVGSKFSYCIGNIYDQAYAHNKLILGENTKIEGDSTPLEVIDGNYYITLEGISVGEKMLGIDPEVFKVKVLGKSGVVIDSGTSASWLAKEGFDVLSNEVQGLLDSNNLNRYWHDEWTLCYQGIVRRDLKGFPTVTFHFKNGADLALDTESLFSQIWSNAFCMAIHPSSRMGDRLDNLSIIGMMAQQYYNVAYDVLGKTLSLSRIDCELLDD